MVDVCIGNRVQGLEEPREHVIAVEMINRGEGKLDSQVKDRESGRERERERERE